MAFAERQHAFENSRQQQRRAEQYRREHGKPRDQGIAEPQQTSGGDEDEKRHRALECQPAALRLLPGLRLRGGQHRQADRLDQARGRRRQRTEHRDRDAGEPPFAPQRQLPGDLRAIETAQGSGDVGQQRGCDEIAADEAGKARDQRQRHQLRHQHAVEHPRRHAAGTQRPQHRQPLLEGETDRRIDDEEADEERQQPERGQIEMKAVGQALEIGRGVRLHKAELVADDAFQRRAVAFALADQQPRNLIRHF